jgi:ribosomal protein S18 acetylase RimI-like enzyme
MISTATEADKGQIHDITARAGVFNQEEVDSVPAMFDEYLKYGAEASGYHFIVYREGERVLGYAIYGFRDLTDGVYDLYWIAVDPSARRKSVGRKLLAFCEEAIRAEDGRMIIAETSGTEEYASTREFYISMGYVNEATIKDFYKPGDDLKVFVKRVWERDKSVP